MQYHANNCDGTTWNRCMVGAEPGGPGMPGSFAAYTIPRTCKPSVCGSLEIASGTEWTYF